jgi:DNA polymerase
VSRRSQILAEMGIAPLWRLRARKDEPAANPPDSAPPDVAPLPAARAAEAVPSLPLSDPREAAIARMDWTELKAAVKGCTACGLRAGCRQTVFGVGDERARWLFVGEAPGAEEDRIGEPFVGQAGKLLDNMLAAIGLERGEDVFIANVLRCRPPNNRDPAPEEIEKCAPFLRRTIALIQPKLIVAMGRPASQTLLNTDATIGSLRGRVFQYAGVPLVVTYHPAYLLRNLPDKAKAWRDLLFAKRTIAGL